MGSFHLNILTDVEFERLANDIIGKMHNCHVECFAKGRDGGIDGKTQINEKQTIIQAKHYSKSGTSVLISKCKSGEAEKVRKLNPDRYILVTSASLTPGNKESLKTIFSPYILDTSDILGEDDIHTYLDQPSSKSILQKNFKLLITSYNALTLIHNQKTHAYSSFTQDEIAERCKLYKHTNNHKKAKEQLEDHKCIIITGSPGAGKTTLAEQLCNELISEDFHLINITSANDALSVYSQRDKQVFLYDDFLGANYLQAIEGKEDHQITKLIYKISNSNNKRFILTSRSSILNQGISISPILKNKNIEKNKYIFKVEELSELERAEILYNHIYHSSLPSPLKSVYFNNKNYRKVINHRNFYPRLIEFITNADYFDNLDTTSYWNSVLEHLSKPKEIWMQAIQKQLNRCDRLLLCVVTFLQHPGENTLKKSYENMEKFGYCDNQGYSSGLQTLLGSFIIMSLRSEDSKYTLPSILSGENTSFLLINPSIADYLIPFIYDEPNLFFQLLLASWSNDRNAKRLTKKALSNHHSIHLRYNYTPLKSAIEKLFENNLYESHAELIHSLYSLLPINHSPEISNTVASATLKTIKSGADHTLPSEAIPVLSYISSSQEINNSNKIDLLPALTHLLGSFRLNHDNLEIISEIIVNEDLESDSYLIRNFEQSVLDSWEDSFSDYMNDCCSQIDADPYTTFDDEDIELQIQQKVTEAVEEILGEYLIDLKINADDFSHLLDTSQILESVRERHIDAQQDYSSYKPKSREIEISNDTEDKIDQIFLRTFDAH